MVIKKPYAFLIKHFRLIHLILSAILIFVAYKVNIILKYFKGLTRDFSLKYGATNYVNYAVIGLLIIGIIIAIIIYILMNYKKKPKLIYLITIIGYLGVIIILGLTFSYCNELEFITMQQREIRLYRDFIEISLYYQYVIIFIMLIRGLGFDINRFNFGKDIQELKIDEKDAEEIELNANIDKNGLSRSLNRSKRELGYYYKENKFFIIFIIVIVILVILSNISFDKLLFNKTYSEESIVSFDNYTLMIENSFITNRGYNGDIIDNDYKYLIVKFKIKNSVQNITIGLKTLSVVVGNNVYIPDTSKCYLFNDIGNCYKKQKVTDKDNSYILIYKLPVNEKNKGINFIFKYDYDNGSYNKKFFKLSPLNNDSDYLQTYKIGNKVIIDNSLMLVNYQINSYEISNKYIHIYNKCLSDGTCYDINSIISSIVGTIIKFDTIFSYENSNVKLNSSSFLEHYGSLYYKVDNKEYKSKLFNNKTPSNSDNSVYFEVDKDINKATDIWLDISVRGLKYKYILKES